MKKITLIIILILFSGLYVSAQPRTCGMEEHMEELLKNPVFARQWAENQKKFNAELLRRQNIQQKSIMDEIVIPVAVHFPEALETDRPCLEALAQNQIDILNGDYTATNPDATLWNVASGFYPGVNHGVANIKFCIATSNHPDNTDDDLVEGGPAVTIGYDFGGGNEADPAWGGYMNFLVKDIGGGLLGFSPLGGNIAAGQAVTMNLGAFGSGAGCPDSGIVPGAPYDGGRTTTHELGHFFNLQHPFSGSCATDDGIADTPNIADPNYGCPNPGTIDGCEDGEFALTMSYMDYGNDACLYMFSEGQTDVVDAYVAALEAQFKPNTVPVCVETPIYTITDGTIETCNGIFYDSGGADNNYSDSENYTFTICPDTEGQVIQLDFTSFEIQANTDILSIYNADNADDPATLIGDFSGYDVADGPGTIIATGTNPTGCLTIVFTSNDGANFSGWQANISCQDPPAECQTILSQLDTASPQPDEDGFILVCTGEEITLTGSATFSEPGGGDGATYQWETGDGTVIDGQTATFSFDEPGVYVANLNVWDTNTSIFPEGCKNTNLINQIIKVSTTPDFSETTAALDTICFGDTTTIKAIVNPTPYYNECTPPESEVTFLPDGSGVSYETSIIVDCFDSDQTLDDINQLVEICLELEHSYLGDLDIEIISPSGQTVVLQNQGGGSANLGVPWATGTVDGESSNTTPGEGYLYCFVPGNSYPTLVDGIQSGGTFPNGDSTTDTYTDSFVPAGTYSSDETLDGLIGSSLNGSWTIRITDNIGLDNGYIFSWSLSFDPALQPANLSFTPEIVSGYWDDDPTIIETNGDIITIAPSTEGQFCYTYTVLDNFDCEYSYEVCVDVLPEIIYDTPTDLLICDQPAPPFIFDLSQNEETMLTPTPNPDDYVVTFHNSPEDAENDVNAIADIINYDGVDQEEIFVRFEYLDSNCFEIESFLLKLIDLPQINSVDDLILCDDLSNDGIEEFDLEQQTIDILGGQSATDYVVTYYTTFETAEAGTDNLVSPYLSTSDEQEIYVRVQSAGGGGCFIVSPTPLFNLIVNNKATATAPIDLTDCDTSATGAVTSTFDLEQQTATILGTQDPSTFTVTYHSTEAEAASGTNIISSPLTTTSTTIYVRVEEDGLPDCYETTQFDIIVYPNPEVSNQTTTICSASIVDLVLGDDVDGPSVVSYDLTAITPEAGLVAGSSNAVVGTNLASDAIALDEWTNTGTTPLDVVYSLVPVSSDNCAGATFTVTVTVNPEPEVSNQTTTICSASIVDLVLGDDVDGPSVVSYDLTAITPEAGLVAGSSNAVVGTNLASDAIALDEWTNTGTTPLDVVYSLVPVSSDNCAGATFTVTVTVNPEPEVSNQTTTICSASIVDLVLGDDVDGPSVVSYDLTAITPEAGLVAGSSNAVVGTNLASDAIALDEWTNTGTTPLDVVYSLVPVSSDNCAGATFTVTVTVNPEPEVSNQTTTICSASIVDLVLGDDVDGPSVVSYDLTAITPEAGLVAGSSNAVLGTNLASDAIALDEWTNTGTTPLDVVYSFIPYDAVGCIGPSFTVTVTVNPEPEVSNQTTTICSASIVDLVLGDDVDGPSVVSYDLTAITPEAGLVAGSSNAVVGTNLASDAIALDEWTNTGTTPLDVVYSLVPVSSDNCAGATFTVTVTVNPEPEVSNQTTTICSASIVDLVLGDDVDGPSVVSYDLTAITPEAGLVAGSSNAVLGTNLASDAIALDEWTNTGTTPLDVVYSLVPVSSDNCAGATFTVTVTVNPEPEVSNQTTTICSASIVDLVLGDDVDGPSVVSYDLTAITPEAGLVAGSSNAVVGTNLASDAIALDEWTNTGTTPLDVVYSFIPYDAVGCIGPSFTVTVTVNPEPVPPPVIDPLSDCDDDTDGLLSFDMSGVVAQVIGSQSDMAVTFHETFSDADVSSNALGNSITTTTPGLQTIFIRLENTLTGCYVISTIDLVVNPLPVVNLEDDYVICSDALGGGLDSVEIDPGLSPSVYSFTWRDELGVILSTASTYTIDQGGIYSLEVSYLSSVTGCSAPLEIFTVSESGSPDVTVDVVTEDFADMHVIVATATGTGIYEFSLDQGPWQDSGMFIGVTPGEHTINVRDVNGCGVTAKQVFIVDYPRYFTPNGDGYHDTWNIPALSVQLGSRILIFDRYGKLLKQISPAGDGWDGTYNGQKMPTTDYWFLLEYNDLTTGEPKQLRAHFSLKR